ncbi:MAG: hypothetical protein R2712_26830 [Vicinamibacterales bacterium]
MTVPDTPRYRSLERLGWATAALAIPFGIGLLVDPRLVDGAPVWLKPAKFAVSIAIYSFTLAWILPRLTAWPRLARTAARTTTVTLALELVLIGAQAARGTASHFNIATPVDAVVFAAMGIAILVQTLVSLAVAVALWRQPFEDRALARALRFGMALAVAGASVGGLMTQPTRAQLAQAEATGTIARAGQHTVGAEDGGPGLPGTGWSVAHGDLRVPHFVGLHALQVLGVLGVLLARRRARTADVRLAERLAGEDARLVAAASASYAGLFVVLLGQALAGQSVTAPAGSILAAFGVWALGSVIALAWGLARRARVFHSPAHAVEVA